MPWIAPLSAMALKYDRKTLQVSARRLLAAEPQHRAVDTPHTSYRTTEERLAGSKNSGSLQECIDTVTILHHSEQHSRHQERVSRSTYQI